MASATTCALIALISGVPRKDIAVATAASYLFRYTGQVVGVAVSSAVLQFFLNRDLHARITGPGAEEVCCTPAVVPYWSLQRSTAH